MREFLSVIFREHSHVYDSDCGMDFGCSCGWGEDGFGVQDSDHAAHLAEITAKALGWDW